MSFAGRAVAAAFFLILAVASQHRGFYASFACALVVAFLFFIDRTQFPKRVTDRQIKVARWCSAIAVLMLFVIEANIHAASTVGARL